MRKHVTIFSLLITVLLTSQIQIGKALQKTYEWNIPADSGYNTYQISIITPDNWQVDTTVNVTLRLTLTSKTNVLDHTEYNKVRVTLNTENFIMDSEHHEGKLTLRDIGDVGERSVYFYIPAEKLNRGQTLNASITFVVTINEFDSVLNRSWVYMGPKIYDPIHINVFRPILSILEIIAVAAVTTVGGICGFILYRRKRIPVEHPSPKKQ